MATYNTYKSAQDAGFSGSYQDWVNQDRPSGGVSNAFYNEVLPKIKKSIDYAFSQIGQPKQGGGTVSQQEAWSSALQYIANASLPFNDQRSDNYNPELYKSMVTQLTNNNADRFGFTPPKDSVATINQITENIDADIPISVDNNGEITGGASPTSQQNTQQGTQNSNDPYLNASSYTQAYNQFRLDGKGNFSDFQAKYGDELSWQDTKAGKTNNGAGEADTTNGTTTTTPDISSGVDNLASAMDVIANSDLPADIKSLFGEVVKGWNPDQDINMENVLTKFNDIKQNTIDPYFAEQVTQFTNDLNTNYSNLQNQRSMELETERANAGQNIRQARGNLEASGMAFTGKGIEQLGGQSAYAQQGESAMPTQTPLGANEDLTQKEGMTFSAPFGGDKRFYEGTVNQGNRLMSSSSLARYQDAQNSLGRQAEYLLGSQNAGQFGLPTQGDVSQGSLDAQRQQRYADTLSGLAGQNRQVNDYRQPYNFNLS